MHADAYTVVSGLLIWNESSHDTACSSLQGYVMHVCMANDTEF